jgi:hypothetical protein
LAVFAVVALSGPGRIDIVDGQTRFEVARNLAEHGKSIILDKRVWFNVYPGRDGDYYTRYRFPQSVLGVPAIWLADATGPRSEGRRHFFFVLTSAFAAGVLAVNYAVWFRWLGQTPLAACAWAAGGIFCTPGWFYATSTFDDILGSAAVVSALCLAYGTRATWPRSGALLAGLLVGLAYNCKQPLGAFMLAAIAFHDRSTEPWSIRRIRILIMVAGVALGVAVEQGYDWWKFPPATRALHAQLQRLYPPTLPEHLLPHLATSLTCLALSPGASVLLYCPVVLMCGYGLASWRHREPAIFWSLLASVAIFSLSVAVTMYFKGDPGWGPRYFTPIFGVLWLFAPAGAAVLRPRLVRMLLVLSLLVQFLGLTVDPHRLYVERGLPSAFGVAKPWLYFVPAIAHLPNRPREIWTILTSDERAPEFAPSPYPASWPEALRDILALNDREYDPAPSPTFAFPVLNYPYLPETGEAAVHRWHVLNSLRPWWCSMWYLSEDERPVDLARTALMLAVLAAFGCALAFAACRQMVRV